MKKCILKRMMPLVLILCTTLALTSCSSSDDNGSTLKNTPVTYMEGTFKGFSGAAEAEAIVEIVDGDQALIIINNKSTGEKKTATVYVEGVIMVEGVDPTVLSAAGEIPSVAYNHKTKKLIVAGKQGGVTMTFSGNKI